MNNHPERASSLRLAFIMLGAAQLLIGINLLSDDPLNRIGYLTSGLGVVLIGFSFSPGYFLAKPGDGHEGMTLSTRVICVIGFVIVILGDMLESL